MEIISLQFGHYSNFIGTHWWNIQEAEFEYSNDSQSEINHDVLYREGRTIKDDVTFTPRLLLADLKGSLKYISEHGDLYEPISNPETSSVLWPDNSLEVVKKERSQPNKFQEALEKNKFDEIKISDFENEVDVWSDFMYSRYHPRTINIVKDYEHKNNTAGFDIFPLGRNYWQNNEFSDEYNDKLRKYIEECDSCQGFQIILDANDAFGGLASSCIEHIRDEYSKKSILAFATIPSCYKYNSNDHVKCLIQDSVKLINLTLCLESLSEHADLVIPLCTGEKGWRQPGNSRSFQHVQFNPEIYYHSSAILASALDTFTMSYRKKSIQYSVGDFCSDLNSHGRKIAAASITLPFPLKQEEDLIDCLNNWEGPLWQSITPNCEIGTDKFMQLITLRGVSEMKLKRPAQEKNKQMNMPAYRCKNVKEMLEFYLSCNSYATASHVTTLNKPLPTKVPYPDIFSESVSVNGNVENESRKNEQRVQNVPVLSGCHVGSTIGDMIESLHKEISRLKFARFPQFETSGLEFDEYNECLNHILDLRYCYEDILE